MNLFFPFTPPFSPSLFLEYIYSLSPIPCFEVFKAAAYLLTFKDQNFIPCLTTERRRWAVASSQAACHLLQSLPLTKPIAYSLIVALAIS